MGMSNYGNSADVIAEQVLKNYSKSLPKFLELLQEVDVQEFVYNDYQADTDNTKLNEQINSLYNETIKEIKIATNMEVCLRYHEQEERGDDINGSFWEVENVSIPNPAISTKLHTQINQCFFVTFE